MLLFALPLDLDTLLAPGQYCFSISNIIDHFGSLSDHTLYMTSHYMYHYYTAVNCFNLKINNINAEGYRNSLHSLKPFK